jgi:KaiC/GvpD/RAD55 family RecA-like ATPase
VLKLRIQTGISGFDELIQGGLIRERVYLLNGPPGSGKTTFCVQFLATGGINNELGLYVSLSESVDNIIADMSNYHFKVKGLINLGRIKFLDLGPEMDYGLYDSMYHAITSGSIESINNDPELSAPTPLTIFEKIEKSVKDNNIERLVIDSLSSIRFSSENIAQEDKEINRFVRNLKKLGCTTILISDMINPNSYTPEQFATHGVLFLHHYLDENTKSMLRAIQVIKMRGTRHDSNMKNLTFTSDGLKVDYKLKE